MKPTKGKHKRPLGLGLIELMVSVGIVSVLTLAAFKILAEGSHYLRTHQRAGEAQRSGLALLTRIGSGLQATSSILISSTPQGLVYASPFKDDGTVEFDSVSQKLEWQKWICFYYDNDEVTLRERDILVPSQNPGAPPVAGSFSVEPVKKVLGTNVTVFQISQLSTTPPLWRLDLTLGSMTAADDYGIELRSEVSPQN